MPVCSWQDAWAGAVRTAEELVRFVNAVGCCTLEPLPRYPDFPCLHTVMGDYYYQAPDQWFWKDDLHIDRRLYYTRVFGGHTGYLSNALLPPFVATNGAAADELLLTGKLTPEAREVYAVIDKDGPVSSKKLKQSLSPDAQRGAHRALETLERQFIVTKVGLTGRTRGTYSYLWDVVERWMPETLAAADRLGRARAAALIREHLASFSIAPDGAFYGRVLGW